MFARGQSGRRQMVHLADPVCASKEEMAAGIILEDTACF